MKHSTYSHRAGNTKLPASLQNEIALAINNIRIVPAAKMARAIRRAFLDGLTGWSGEFPVSKGSGITITSLKNKVGLCVQTGNMARIYADLIKLQTLYHDDLIKAAAIVLPSKAVATELGSNIANADRLSRELEVFVKVYDVPTVIFALE